MTFLKIEPNKQSVTLLNENSDLAVLARNYLSNSVEVEKGLRVVSIPDENNGFFYFVVQNGMEGEIHTFKGIGVAFGEGIEERIEEIEGKIVW